MTHPRNTDGATPISSLGKRLSAYPVGTSLEERTETALLLDGALDAADPNAGDIAAWLRQRQGALN